MNSRGKNYEKIILSISAAMLLAAPSFSAENFDLNSLGLPQVQTTPRDATRMAVPVAKPIVMGEKSANLPPALDMTIKLPFAALSQRIAEMPLAQITAIDKASPILYRESDHITLSNINVNYNGIEVVPTLQIKPYFEGNNNLAIKVVKIETEIVFGPKAMLDKDGLMEMVMSKLTTGMTEAMDKAFAGNKVALKAADVISFKYDRKSWTLRATVVPTFVAPLLPGLISDVSLSGFTFDDEGFALSVQSGSAASIAKLPGYNLAISDGMITKFITKFSAGSDFNLLPEKHEGGLKFRADGRLEVAGKVYVRTAPLKPNVYFKATMQPIVTKDNTIWLRVERIEVDQAYGIGVPGFLNNWLQGTIIKNVLKTVLNNADLKKVMTAKKLDDKTLEMTLKNSAFLPSFANGATIKGMKIGNGLLYLAFAL
ncbi:MAG TPA: hypothetical protein PKI19_11220 [Elusimicrobiales bacterium]|nr:hypothetical protein [Elusimicrobiales bacterium]